MNERRLFPPIEAAIALERARVGPVEAWTARERTRHFLAEIDASCRLAGCRIDAASVAALVVRDAVVSAGPLGAFVLVADYTEAARYVARASQPGPRRPYLRMEEILALHALATRRSLGDRPGQWRETTVPALRGGIVAPPAWLVPSRMAAFVERFASGPGPGIAPLYWAAEAHQAFARLHPFATANGRVGRLVLNLLLRRIGLPSFVPSGSRTRAYARALDGADAGDLWPLALVLARTVYASLTQAAAAATPAALAPLGALAGPGERAALYKAAQRGRLRTVRRGGALLTTAAWLAEYRTSRAAAGRPERLRSERRAGDPRSDDDGENE